MSSCSTSTRSVDPICLARSGRTCCSAAAITVPTSAIVSATVSLSCLNSERCTSRTAFPNSSVNARLPTTPEATDSMIGRAATRSALFFNTTSSVIFSPISDLTLSSRSAAVARLAN